MRIAILGATGCVGRNLINKLIKSSKHEIIASYRIDKEVSKRLKNRRIIWTKVNMQDPASTEEFLRDADVLVYLIHSLGYTKFESLDIELAHQVSDASKRVGIKKIIYLSGIISKGQKLSHHLKSRVDTGVALAAHGISVGEVRASILLGTCSASYRIVYFLSKRLPIMITPSWLNSLCSPIALEDAVYVIESLIMRDINGHEIFEIGSDVLRYRDLVSLCGKAIHGYKNIIIPVPFFTISLSALWIWLITGVSRNLARALAESIVDDTVFSHNRFKEITGRDPIPVEQALYQCVEDMKKREHQKT
ncbi:MAG: NAD(P)H-binding protein [Candidatus Scalinduaceae bacterium]